MDLDALQRRTLVRAGLAVVLVAFDGSVLVLALPAIASDFNARTPEDKQRFREEDADIREELALALEEQGMLNTTARQLAGWNPYDQNAHAPFFDSE